jgi:hypothetical protein
MKTRSSLRPYVYNSLDRNMKEIRLLRLRYEGHLIQYDICTFSHDESPDYIALSHTWGLPTPTFPFLVQGDNAVHIRENLYNFMQAYKHECYLWIDQICINQSNVFERNHQVAIMSEIYKRATFVLIWSQTLYLALSHRLLDLAIRPYHEQVEEILKDPYFTRLWVIQEVLLAKDVKILTSVGTTRLSGLQKWLFDTMEYVRADQKLRLVTEYASAYQLLMISHDLPLTLHACIKLFHRSECQDPRDRVYGLMGLVFEGQRLEIDYSKSTHEVFSDVLVAFCSTYASNVIDSGDYFYTLIRLLGGMRFKISEALALERLLRSLWKLESFELVPKPEYLGHLPMTAMGFERTQTQKFTENVPAQPSQGDQGHWWYDYHGERKCFDVVTSVPLESREDEHLMEALAYVDHICTLELTLSTFPEHEGLFHVNQDKRAGYMET